MSRGDRIAPILLVAHDLRKLRSGKNIAEPLERTSRYSRGTAGEKTTRHQQCYGSTCYRKIIYRRQSTRQITGCFIWRAADRCSARYQPTGRAPTDRRGCAVVFGTPYSPAGLRSSRPHHLNYSTTPGTESQLDLMSVGHRCSPTMTLRGSALMLKA